MTEPSDHSPSAPLSPHGSFDYSALPGNTARAAAEAAVRVRARVRRVVDDIIANGNDLVAIKQQLDHGIFGKWLRAEFGWSERSAERFMRAARWAAGKTASLSDLEPSAIYLLSAASMPAAVTDTVLSRLQNGEAVMLAEVRELVHRAKKAEIGAQRAPTTEVNDLAPPNDPAFASKDPGDIGGETHVPIHLLFSRRPDREAFARLKPGARFTIDARKFRANSVQAFCIRRTRRAPKRDDDKYD